MHVLDILNAERVAIADGASSRGGAPGAGARPGVGRPAVRRDDDGAVGGIRSKAEALRVLAQLLARGDSRLSALDVEAVLVRREELQSTGVGGGVAIPHGSMDQLERIVGALLVCKQPIDFAAIDGEPVSILFAIVGPKRSTGEHLKTLARVSRLLRDDDFRRRLVDAPTADRVVALIGGEET
jgi:PTS system nitrogen regulatory IIA component